ncbi:small ribosomal subunit protein eS21 isoform X1 [Syngnathus scovelli]|uniref:small ribosomal subunit protein eS21-like isoform X1 n=4 Tax=Syngnathus scovelli TaxID=161590 RepID=UPI0035CC5E26
MNGSIGVCSEIVDIKYSLQLCFADDLLINMQNDAGEFVDLYVPRKCSASNRIIGAKDHASVQINIAEVDNVTGRFNSQFKTYAICGAIRRMGESDDSILRLAKNDGVVAKNI